VTPLPQFDPHEVAHRDDCYEIEPGRFCDCPTMSNIDIRKDAPRLLGRVDTMLATYERRQSTNVPGTISLIRDLAAALRAEMKGWASARGDAVDYSLRADATEAIVRGLAETGHPVDDRDICLLCWEITPSHVSDLSRALTSTERAAHHDHQCPWRQAQDWVEAHPETDR